MTIFATTQCGVNSSGIGVFWSLQRELKLGLPSMGVSSAGVGKVEASVGHRCCHVGSCVSGSSGETEEAAAGVHQWPGCKEQWHTSGIVVKSKGRGCQWSPPWFPLSSPVDVSECHVNGELCKL